MQGEVVERIAELATGRKPFLVEPGVLAHPTDWTLTDPATLVKAGPTAAALVVATLGAVVGYLAKNRDALALERIIVHVESPNSVKVLGPLAARARNRETLVAASCPNLMADFLGRFMPPEEFVIGMQVRFQNVLDRSLVLGLIGNIKSADVKTSIDDGFTQTVEARSGVALKADAVVPNPVTLVPFRTFREVEQPASVFVLRVQQGREGGQPSVGLFAADGGEWCLKAIDAISVWIRTNADVASHIAVIG